MQVGAVITLSRPQENDIDSSDDSRRRSGFLSATNEAALTVLGNNLLERSNVALRAAGVERPTLLRERLPLKKLSREPHSKSCVPLTWEKALADASSQGFDHLLLIGTYSYTELNYDDLLKFHLGRGAALTQVYAEDAPLDIAVVTTAKLRNTDGSISEAFRTLISERERFSFRGYVNRLRGPADFMKLIEDSLYERNGLRPAGTEVARGLWLGEDAELDDSCVIDSPSFIGAGTRIAACCRISGASAIESACHVDSGTVVERSWILPGTYVGIGLNVRHSIVSKQKIFHLDRETEVTINDRRLIGATRSLPFFGSGDGLLSRMQLGSSDV